MKNFLKSLIQATDLAEHYAYIEDRAKQQPDELVSLFKELPSDWMKLLNSWQQRAAYSRIIEAICLTPGKEQIKSAIQIADVLIRERDFDRMASFLVSAQDKTELISLLMSTGNKSAKSMLLLVAHELIARGNDLRTDSNFAAIERYNQQGNFKELVLFPLESERNFTFPSYKIGSMSHSINFTLKSIFSEIDKSKRIDMSLMDEGNNLAIALLNWEEASNGKILGLRGTSNSVVTVESLLSSLECFAEDKSFQCNQEDSGSIVSYLFDACANGAAYNSGIFGAKGRLNTWLSLSRMMGLNPSNSNDVIEREMQNYNWYRFTTDSWFHNEIWDLGIICISKKDNSFGLIAGTDID